MLDHQTILPTYRVYFLSLTGSIVAAAPIPAANDEEARAFAATLSSEQPKELWERRRRIAVYPRSNAAIEGVI